jgi:hypothetical protein
LTEKQRDHPSDPGTDPAVRLGIMRSVILAVFVLVPHPLISGVGFRTKAGQTPLSVNLVFIEDRKQIRECPQIGLCDMTDQAAAKQQHSRLYDTVLEASSRTALET